MHIVGIIAYSSPAILAVVILYSLLVIMPAVAQKVVKTHITISPYYWLCFLVTASLLFTILMLNAGNDAGAGPSLILHGFLLASMVLTLGRKLREDRQHNKATSA